MQNSMTFLHWTISTYAVDTRNNTPGIHKVQSPRKDLILFEEEHS